MFKLKLSVEAVEAWYQTPFPESFDRPGAEKRKRHQVMKRDIQWAWAM